MMPKIQNKIKAVLTINVGLYEDIRPEVEIDLNDIESSKETVKKLYLAFHGLGAEAEKERNKMRYPKVTVPMDEEPRNWSGADMEWVNKKLATKI